MRRVILLIIGFAIVIDSAPLSDETGADPNVPFNHSNLTALKEGLAKLREKVERNHKKEEENYNQDQLRNSARRMPSVLQDDEYEEEDDDPIPDYLTKSQPENALGDSIIEANEKSNLFDYLYQGDIILTEEQLQYKLSKLENNDRDKRQAFTFYHPLYLWGKKVYYYFDKTATEKTKEIFRAAADFWQANTCIDVIESSTATNRIRVIKGLTCSSFVGVMKGVQDLSLGGGCESLGTAAHELGHAIGFHHQQSRVDRDDSITVLWKNIQDDRADQFLKETNDTNYNYDIIYDYGSIMQYDAWSFSKNQNVTMKPRKKRYKMTMGSDIIAFYDIRMLNLLYKCDEYCNPNTSAKCQNKGFPSPRNCSVCICPGSFGSTLCDQRPDDGCGATLEATKEWQYLNVSINGPENTTLKLDPIKCHWWITVTDEKKGIELQLIAYNTVGRLYGGCIWGGVEFKTLQDQARTGYRLCSMNRAANTTFKAYKSLAPVMVYSYKYQINATIRYRAFDGKIFGKIDPVNDNDRLAKHKTTTPKPKSTKKPKQKPADCFDQMADCGALANYGYCSQSTYSEMCKKSCSMC